MSSGPGAIGSFKVALVGPTLVGKTSIVKRLHESVFFQHVDNTVGAQFLVHEVRTPQGTITLHLWDTAGQERYRSVCPMYTRDAVVLIVVYDLAAPESLDDAKVWCDQSRATGDPNMDVYVVGNKIDLSPDAQSQEVGREYAELIGAHFYATSASTGEGIQQLFQEISERLAERRGQGTPIRVPMASITTTTKEPCC
jgi:Ras-related protein Rab-5C